MYAKCLLKIVNLFFAEKVPGVVIKLRAVRSEHEACFL